MTTRTRTIALILSFKITIIFKQSDGQPPTYRMPNTRLSRATPSRKKQHIDITLTKDVGFREKTTGLEQWEFVHNALPEINFSEIDTSTTFLNKHLTLPFMVSCMTGGYAEALRINRGLAEVCEELGIAMGVGSQRQALEHTAFHRTFRVVREAAPSIPLVGNLGAAEIAATRSIETVKRLVDLIGADAFAVHLNPLQELLQPEGNTNFKGVLNGIALLVRDLPVPVIVKEIGAGISVTVAKRLLDIGVQYVDVAGAGGTSWAGVEILRRGKTKSAHEFWDWGIPTATALQDVVALRSSGYTFHVIGSGGISTGMEAAKCIGLGADLVASARPMLKALINGGKKALTLLIRAWGNDLRSAMFLTGSATVRGLQNAPLARYGSHE
jgi:isopentenyl-diphosphate delta-isomerase